MILAGKNIQSAGDPLQKITLDHLYHSLRSPRPDIESHLRQLRIVRDLDTKQYAMLKRQLPYIVCGIFNPLVRRTENFAYIEHFILDIDHISEKGFELEALRQLLQTDPRVMMTFVSPSEDGLKVLFRLKERCYDAGIYTLFYKAFLLGFSRQFRLEQVIDSKTSDVTRACFISQDANAYYNPDAEPVDLNAYVNTEDAAGMFEMKHALDQQTITTPTITEELHQPDPDKDVMAHIKAVLKGKTAVLAPKEQAPIAVPAQLDEILPTLKQYIEEHGIELTAVINIQYAKKMQFRLGGQKAEINLFYGKRGYKVVQSPKCGTSAELNALIADLITVFLFENT